MVTGGAGFIGGHVARSLLGRGWEVLVVDDLSSGARPPDAPRSRLLVADIIDPAVARAVVQLHPDLVVHAAAQVSVPRSVADPGRDHLVNVDGTARIVTAARASGTPRFVFLSSGGAVYGEADGADESTTPAPTSPYGLSKLEAELIVRDSGLSYGIARLANVYGPGQRSDLEGGVVAVFLDRIVACQPIDINGDGSQTRDFIHVEDVVAAIETLSTAERSGVWNVATGTSTSIRALVGLVERLTATTATVVHRPARPGDVQTSRLSIDKIQHELGWRPRLNLAAGVAAMLASDRGRATRA